MLWDNRDETVISMRDADSMGRRLDGCPTMAALNASTVVMTNAKIAPHHRKIVRKP